MFALTVSSFDKVYEIIFDQENFQNQCLVTQASIAQLNATQITDISNKIKNIAKNVQVPNHFKILNERPN